MSEPRDPEPQVHGKQLVFLFMAATVAAVVVFLAGVMVGRGVRLQRGGFAVGEMAADPTVDPAPPLAAPTGTTAQGPSPASREGLTYPSQLSDLNPPDVLAEPAEDPTAEVLGRATPKAPETPAATATGKRAEKAAAKPAEKPAEMPAPSTPVRKSVVPRVERPTGEAGPGYAVQVAAVRDSGDADRIAARLKGKGYSAYITSPAPGMFRVRVGKFEELRDAQAAAARLEKEEQFKPWITR
ncbi:MAG: SPOR domain-containing protein [Vicinamibacterales bacterium]